MATEKIFHTGAAKQFRQLAIISQALAKPLDHEIVK
jgi:hypothetical protein